MTWENVVPVDARAGDRVCEACGAARNVDELASIITDGETRYFCHPVWAKTTTCYVDAAQAEGRLVEMRARP